MTDKKTEALKLALEALEAYGTKHAHTYGLDGAWDEEITRGTLAVMSIREALAEQPAQQQEPGRNHWEDGDVFERIAAMKKQPAPVAKPHEQQSAERGEPVAVYVGETWCGSVVRLYEDLSLETPLYTSPQPAQQQEPVAEVKLMQQGGNAGLATVIHEIFDPMREPLRVGDKLYTSPPASKPWVGLTDEERRETINRAWNEYVRGSVGGDSFSWCLSQAIEAKLREKNA